jgi:hypothetical protein
MIRNPFPTTSSYLHSLRGLHELHRLALQDQNDSTEADEIRDGLEQVWSDLSTIEQDRLDGLSEDLYSISDPPQEPLPSRRLVQRKLIQVGEAIEAGNWDVALNLLREVGRQVEPALLSELRGEIWQAAGDDATAKLFFDHAASLTPELADKT